MTNPNDTPPFVGRGGEPIGEALRLNTGESTNEEVRIDEDLANRFDEWRDGEEVAHLLREESLRQPLNWELRDRAIQAQEAADELGRRIAQRVTELRNNARP